MALGYTQQAPLNYTAFLQTSFGYGFNELQSLSGNPFPNATDYAKVVITAVTPTHWDDTAHIKTQEYNSAISIYNKETQTWSVEGERNDVEYILSQLTFYPPTYNDIVTFSPDVRLFDGGGDISNITLPSIPDTQLAITVYKSTGFVTGYDIHIEANPVVYSNKRPYFPTQSSELIDFSSANYDNSVGDYIDFGQISDGGDDDNIEVKCKFLDITGGSAVSVTYGSQNNTTTYGEFTGYNDIYISDKKPSTFNTTDKRFAFIGNMDECQAFLDNVRFKANANRKSFGMEITVSDGVLESYHRKLMWHPQTLDATTFPTQTGTEDLPLYFDIGTFDITNSSNIPEVYEWIAELAIDTVGQSGIQSVLNADSYTNGVITITESTITDLKTSLNNLQLLLNTDFNTEFYMTVDITANGALGTTYSMTQQNVGFVITDVDEYSFTDPSPVSWEEDHYIYLDTQFEILDTSYGGNASYTVYLRPDVATGIDTITLDGTFAVTVTGSGTQSSPLELTGTRANLNLALANIKITPELDFTGSFNIDIKAVRNNDSEVFTDYGETIGFSAGTQLDPLQFSSSHIGYHADDVYTNVGLTDVLSLDDFTTVDLTEEIYTGNYELRIQYDTRRTLTIPGLVFNQDYFLTGYPTPTTSDYYYIVGNKAQVQQWLETLRLRNLDDADFTVDISVVRINPDNQYVDTDYVDVDYVDDQYDGLFTTTLNYYFIETPEIASTQSLTLAHSFNYESPSYNIALDYTGSGSSFSVENIIYNSYKRSGSLDTTASYTGQMTVTDYSITSVSTNNITLQQTGKTDSQDNEAQYETFAFVIKVNAHTDGLISVPDVYKRTTNLNKVVYSRDTYTYTSDIRAGDVHFVPYERSTPDYINLVTGSANRSYTIDGDLATRKRWFSNTGSTTTDTYLTDYYYTNYYSSETKYFQVDDASQYPEGINSNMSYKTESSDHLFTAYAADITPAVGATKFHLTVFHPWQNALTQYPDHLNEVKVIDSSFHATTPPQFPNRLQYDIETNFGITNGEVVDTFYDEVNEHFYVLIIYRYTTSSSANLIRIDTANDYTLDLSSPNVTLMTFGGSSSLSGSEDSGAIGRTRDGDIFVAFYEDLGTNGSLVTVWEHSTGTTLTRQSSATYSDMKFYAVQSLLEVEANANSCFMMGNNLFAKTGGSWTRTSYSANNTYVYHPVYSDYTHPFELQTTLTKDFFVYKTFSNPSQPTIFDKIEIYRIEWNNNTFSAVKVYEETDSTYSYTTISNGNNQSFYVWTGSKRGNVITRTSRKNNSGDAYSSPDVDIYRFTT